MDIGTIPTGCDIAFGGYVQLQYAPISWFDTPNAAYHYDNAWVVKPQLKPLKTWRILPFVKVTDRAFGSSVTSTKFGDLSDVTIQAVLPSLNPSVQAELQRMSAAKFFIINLLDKAGVWWTIGTPDSPARFDYDIQGGRNTATPNQVVVSFKAKTVNSFIKTY